MNYADIIYDSRLDVFKNDGDIRTTSFTVSGTLNGSSMRTFTAPTITVDSPDFGVLMFDNSRKHSGQYRGMAHQYGTLVRETTNNSDLTLELTMRVTGNNIVFSGTLMNAYSTSVALQSTVINFIYIPYTYTI